MIVYVSKLGMKSTKIILAPSFLLLHSVQLLGNLIYSLILISKTANMLVGTMLSLAVDRY